MSTKIDHEKLRKKDRVVHNGAEPITGEFPRVGSFADQKRLDIHQPISRQRLSPIINYKQLTPKRPEESVMELLTKLEAATKKLNQLPPKAPERDRCGKYIYALIRRIQKKEPTWANCIQIKKARNSLINK